MSIGAKIMAGCLGLTMITLVVGLLGQAAQSRLGDIALRLYDDAFTSMSYLRAAQNELAWIAADLARGDTTQALVVERLEKAAADLGVARTRATSREGSAIAARLLDELRALADSMQSAGPALGDVGFWQVSRRMDTAAELFASDGYRARRAAMEVAEQTAHHTWAAIALSLAIAFGITALLRRAILPSLRHAVEVATSIAAGRLDNVIATAGQGRESRNETHHLLHALAAMQARIAWKITRIQDLLATQASTHADEIAAQNERFEAALDNMSQGLCMFDAAGRLRVANRRFGEMFGTPGEGAPDHEALPEPLLHADTDHPIRTLDDGRIIAVAREAMIGGGWVATFEDITERCRTEARLAHMAGHDPLTGLPNRMLYREQMEQVLAQARRGGGIAVLCIDIDNFKGVNDSLGHAVGDALLRAAAQRLVEATRESDIVVRLGGDEFAIIQIGATQPTAAKVLAERLVASLARPFDAAGHIVTLGASIGIAVTTDGLTTGDGMLKCADLALDRAKADGRGTYRFFEAEMDARMQARRRLEQDLRRAVAADEFDVYYQPLIDTRTGTVNGFEGLVRWRHPIRGMVPPAEFISVAEDVGLIAAIGDLVLNRACRDAAHWPGHVKIAVNLSPLQFRNRDLARDVAAVLSRSGLDPARLELEITESLFLQDSDSTLAILHELRALGVGISMDDFGTGYSSLSYLRRFPFDKIKIDQSFIRNLGQPGATSIAIVRAVVGLGASLGMWVTAEGVETEEQFALLRTEGCDQVQGYLFSKPRPVAEVQNLIETIAEPV